MATRTTGDWEQQGQAEVNKAINEQYQSTDDFLNSMVRYPTLPHADAVFLINELDVVLRNCIKFVSQFSTYFIDELERIMCKHMFSSSNRDIFCASGDSILPTALHYLTAAQDLDVVLNNVRIYRLYWLLSLSALRDRVTKYVELSYVDTESDDYVDAREEMVAIENDLGIEQELMFGVVNEIEHYSRRVQKIQDKLTMPYLRKVAAMAKMRASGGKFEACMDNYQSGVPGIFQAIGRYNTDLGSYASLVEMWVNNRMLIGIRKFGNPIRVPDRAHKHKRMYEAAMKRNPLLHFDEVAAQLGIDEKTLSESLTLVDMQGTSALIDEGSTDDFGAGNEDYVVEDVDDSVNGVMKEYGYVLRDPDRAVIQLLFGCDVDYDPIPEPQRRIEAARHLLTAHLARIAKG